MKMENLSDIRARYKEIQRNKYFYLSLTLATSSIFIVFAIRPTVIQALETYTNLQELKEIETKLVDKNEKLAIAKSLLEQNSQKTELLNKSLPSQAEESIFLGNLNEAAYRNQIILDDIMFSFSNTNESGDYKEVPFEASFDSEYKNFSSFIKDINNFLRLVEITEIKIQENASLKGKRIKGKIAGKIFYKTK